MDRDTDALMSEISERLTLLEDCLPRQLDGYAISRASKLPFIAVNYRETLAWRMAELSRCAYDELARERFAAAILLTRAAVETCAALWYLDRKISVAIEAQSLGETGRFLRQLFAGNRIEPEGPQAISVLTFVGSVEKDLEGFREQYDILSETSHPNWAGTTGLYSKIDYTRGTAVYGSNARLMTSPKTVGAANLSVALMLFEHTYNNLSDSIGDFVAVCDAEAKNNPTKTPDNA